MPTGDSYEVMGVAVSPELYAQILKRADKNKKTISEIACDLIIAGLEAERDKRRVK